MKKEVSFALLLVGSLFFAQQNNEKAPQDSISATKEIQAVLKAIDDGLITFNEALPQIESNIYKRLLKENEKES